MIQKRTILETGSFPYVLNTVNNDIQSIPIDTENTIMLNIAVVPKSGPDGSADGIYYLFKPNYTIIINSNSRRPTINNSFNIGSRSRELQSDFDSWKEACERFGIKNEDSFILVDPDNNTLSKRLSLNAIPRYIIINKSGEIVNTDATRPSDPCTFNTLL